ncbi:hypothetical protein HPCPY6081_1611 [Helicobacter pylori CPY6081]|nr:hypothetical protein HPCPY6081_1611 [Helicobacter pylori CPY6081]
MPCPSFTPYLNIGRYKILQQTRFKALASHPIKALPTLK